MAGMLGVSTAVAFAAGKEGKPAKAESAVPALPPGIKPDMDTGQQINGVCAACHGPLGQGGKKGEYPRIAGMTYEYLHDQLMKFKERKRVNLPMFPYTKDRELSDEDVVHIAAYVSQLKLITKPPVFKEDEDALVRLQAMDKVFNVPRAEGDVEAGATLYRKECASCHGAKGQGKKKMPMLSGQYTQYLNRQVSLFTKGERIHDEDLKDHTQDVLSQMKPEEIRDILAYLSILDDEE
jgi:cytochrome c553